MIISVNYTVVWEVENMYICTMSVGIYKITSPSNRVYIGQSINIEQRFIQHKTKSKCKGLRKLYYSFLKYGVDHHCFEIIENCDVDLLDKKERYWQLFYNSIDNGLNCHLTEHCKEKTYLKILKRKEKAYLIIQNKINKKKESEYRKSQIKLVNSIINKIIK